MQRKNITAVIGWILLVSLTSVYPAGAVGLEGSTSSLDPHSGNGLQQSVGAEEALEHRERAQDLLAELQRVDEDPMMSVEQSTIRSVRGRVQNGNLSYDRANYAEAVNHWQIAQEQARAALQSCYAAGADRSLNATADYLDERTSDGYQSAQLSEYQERVAALRAQSPESLADHRQRYEAARELHDDVESSLPSSTVVDLANLLSPLWLKGVSGVLGFGLVGSVAGFAGYRLGSGEGDGEEGDEGDENEREGDERRQF